MIYWRCNERISLCQTELIYFGKFFFFNNRRADVYDRISYPRMSSRLLNGSLCQINKLELLWGECQSGALLLLGRLSIIQDSSP